MTPYLIMLGIVLSSGFCLVRALLAEDFDATLLWCVGYIVSIAGGIGGLVVYSELT